MTPSSLRPTSPGRSRRLAAAGAVVVLTGGAALGLAGPAAAAGDGSRTSTASQGVHQQKAGTGWVRAGHLVDGVGEADVRLTPYAGGTPVTIKGVSYGDLTPYRNVPTGLYTVSLLPAGASSMSAAMISTTVKVGDGSAATVVATGTPSRVDASVVQDDLTPPPAGQAKVRLISAASGTPVDAQVVGGPLLAKAAAAGSTTGYATIAAQTWSVRLSAASTTGSTSTSAGSTTSRVPVRAGGVYTLVALGKPGDLKLEAVRDTGAPGAGSVPTGGVDTGAGGLARDASPAGSSAGALLGASGLGFAVVLGGTLVAVRRRGGAPR